MARAVLSHVCHDGVMPGTRELARAQTTARILAAAREEIASHGGGGLSMRAIAREVGLVSSAVYRYFPTREALLTAMIVESYGHLDAALGAAPGDSGPDRWRGLAAAFRDWARDHPHEFQLVYGTPIPGYQAPPETVPAAAAVAAHFLDVGAQASVAGFTDDALVDQLTTPATESGADPSGYAAVLADLAALVGFVSLELAGHFVGTADPADDLYAALVGRQVRTLGL